MVGGAVRGALRGIRGEFRRGGAACCRGSGFHRIGRLGVGGGTRGGRQGGRGCDQTDRGGGMRLVPRALVLAASCCLAAAAWAQAPIEIVPPAAQSPS